MGNASHLFMLFCAASAPIACYSPSIGEPGETTGADADNDSNSPGESTGDDPSGTAPSTATSTEPTAPSTMTSPDSSNASSTDASESTIDPPLDSSGEAPDPFCGDLNLDPGEECDDGDANASNAGCRLECTLARCGDGDVWAGVEGCDDGDGDNILEVGACAPDCSRVIEERHIQTGAFISSGGFGLNPVAYADSLCEPGYRALFAYPGVREAAQDPLDPEGSIDWVLQPYTAYVGTEGDELVWITDQVPLLGVREGALETLLAPFAPECPPPVGGVQVICLGSVVTGLNMDWTTATQDDCDGWTTASDSEPMRTGWARSAVDYLYASSANRSCDDDWGISVLCVEQ